MKKLMLGLAIAAVGSAFAVESSNVVGYQNKGAAAGDRAMRVVSTFLPINGTAGDLTLGDIKQIGTVGDFTLTTYGNNVNSLNEYWYFDADVASEMSIDEGWYVLTDDDGETVPDFDAGVQNDESLPRGQGCVVVSVSDDATYTSAGAVDSIEREFYIAAGDRKMTGNILPKAITLGQIKQIGTVGDFTLTTYGNNVNSLNEYWYFDADVASEMSIDEGWYVLMDDDGETVPDFEAGVQNVSFGAGEGFVVVSVSDDAFLRFPKAY